MPAMEKAKERLVSLDAFRGATIAAMILVNNAGDWGHVYRQLEHAEWHGLTLTDLIFPFFVFIMGVAIPLAPQKGAGPILRRAALLAGLGVFLSAFPFNLPYPVRLPGVLQRIALCYLVCAPLSARVSSRGLFAIALALLAGYALALELGGDLSATGNVGAKVDRFVFGKHCYRGGDWDPEGLVSSIPAIATALSGVLAGRWITDSNRTSFERACGLFVAGLACLAVGFAWNAWQPINKNLWTSSYVFFTSGLALQSLAASYWLVDIHGWRAWAKPFLSFGRNAIFVYMAAHLLARLLVYGIKVAVEGAEKPLDAKTWLYRHVFATSTCFTSMLWALGYVTIWWGIVALMDRKRIYIRV